MERSGKEHAYTRKIFVISHQPSTVYVQPERIEGLLGYAYAANFIGLTWKRPSLPPWRKPVTLNHPKKGSRFSALTRFVSPTVLLLIPFVLSGQISFFITFLILLGLTAGALWHGSLPPRPIDVKQIVVDTTIAVDIIDSIADPILLLNETRRVIGANRAARILLGEGIEDRDLAISLRHPETLDAVNEVLSGAVEKATATVTFPVPIQRVFEATVAGVTEKGGKQGVPSIRAVIALHDITEVRGAEQMRADFVANVSHELRSPLTALIGFIETLSGVAEDDRTARKKFLSIMETESQRMARLIDDLLSLSKVESKEHVNPTSPVDLGLVLHQVADTLSNRASAKGTLIDLDVPPSLAEVPGDRDQIIEVFHNLMDNAVKYSRDGAVITVSATETNRIPELGAPGIKVSVKDEGDGIPAEIIPRLTERFFRVDKGRSREMGGTGLGLAIVKHIVNRHRGRLLIESVSGKGSTFSVYLPLFGPQFKRNRKNGRPAKETAIKV